MAAVHHFRQFIVVRRSRLTARVRLTLSAAVASLLLLCGVGCADSDDPVATVSVGVDRATVPLGGPIELSFRFVASPRLEVIDDDYRVLVHFLDENGDLMWADDHEPPVPTGGWQPGQAISYTRHTIVPMYPYIGEATIAVGLYSVSSGERLALAGEDLGERAYYGTVLNLEAQAGSSFLLFEDGWHGEEFNPEVNLQWRWTSEQASLSFRNPRRDAVLYLRLDGRPDLSPSGQQRVTLRVGDEVLHQLVLETREPRFEQLRLAAGQLGDGETSRIDLDIQPTFVPAETSGGDSVDDRRLGVRVYYAFLETL